MLNYLIAFDLGIFFVVFFLFKKIFLISKLFVCKISFFVHKAFFSCATNTKKTYPNFQKNAKYNAKKQYFWITQRNKISQNNKKYLKMTQNICSEDKLPLSPATSKIFICFWHTCVFCYCQTFASV